MLFNWNIWTITNFVELKDNRYNFHPNENRISRKWKPTKSSKTHYQFNIDTKLGEHWKAGENEKHELEFKSYPNRETNKNQKTVEKTKQIDVECLQCTEREKIEFEKR